ncbi:TfoX/Sxy family protein [Nocardia sp. NPDC127526]|uniref:TfoX/Sxy family protein n=1 Tax=Nocardia sp. NPDC127526 TaxID=3345393 RepID=UPI00363259A4
MAYDEELAERIRDSLGPEMAEAVEKKMFGGLGFMIDGNMAVAASGKGGLLVRVGPEAHDELVRLAGASAMVMGGRESRGWLRIDDAVLAEDKVLDEWVARGVAAARSAPKKSAPRKKAARG